MSSAPEATPPVYLSYNSREGESVVRVAERLRREGIDVWLDVWQLRPGDRWQDRVEEAQQGGLWVVFLGPHGLGPYHGLEVERAATRVREARAAGSEHGFVALPVLLPGWPEERDRELPPLFREAMRIRFRSLDDEEAYALLVGAIRERNLGRSATNLPPAPAEAASAGNTVEPRIEVPPFVSDPARLAEVLARLAFQDRSQLRLCEQPDADSVRAALTAAKGQADGFEERLREATPGFEPNPLWKAWMIRVHGERLRQIAAELSKASLRPGVPPPPAGAETPPPGSAEFSNVGTSKPAPPREAPSKPGRKGSPPDRRAVS